MEDIQGSKSEQSSTAVDDDDDDVGCTPRIDHVAGGSTTREDAGGSGGGGPTPVFESGHEEYADRRSSDVSSGTSVPALAPPLPVARRSRCSDDMAAAIARRAVNQVRADDGFGASEPLNALNDRESVLRHELHGILVSFYNDHNPSKLDQVDDLVDKYWGRRPSLLKALTEKYGVDVS